MEPDRELLKKVLAKGGYFLTKPRLRLFRTMQSGEAMTTREIIERMDRYDQATVYRTIKLFEEIGVIKRMQMGWSSRLELTDAFAHHHHHLTCLKCNQVITLPEDTFLESEISRLSFVHRFKAIDHQLEIRGFCATCAK